MYIPTTVHVTPLATIRRERLLPQPGYVLVADGERVEAATVVAKTEIYSRHYFFDLTQRLNVPLDQAEKHVRVQPNNAIEKREIIAQRAGLFGPKTVRAPAKGTVVEVKNGKVLFAVTGPELEVKAGFPGVVVSLNPDWGVMIETPGALVQGVWGTGKQEYGLLKMLVNDPTQPLSPELLDPSCAGAIVMAGLADDKALRLAESVKIRGLIVGGLSSALLRLARSLSFPTLVVEGFGKQMMSAQAWTLLADHNGREVFLDTRPVDRWEGRRPEVIIPLPHPGGTVALPADGQALSEGKRVRVTRAPYSGALGTLTHLPERMAVLPSGVQAPVAQVELDGQGSVTVALANLEIYE